MMSDDEGNRALAERKRSSDELETWKRKYMQLFMAAFPEEILEGPGSDRILRDADKWHEIVVGHAVGLNKEVADLKRALAAERAETVRLKGLLDRDQTGLAAALAEIHRIAVSYSWVTEGRGPYAWDDDEYRAEMGRLIAQIRTITMNELRESGRRAHAAFHPKEG